MKRSLLLFLLYGTSVLGVYANGGLRRAWRMHINFSNMYGEQDSNGSGSGHGGGYGGGFRGGK